MKKTRRIGIIDLVAKGPTRALYSRLMYANLASIMPQVVAAWCEAEGHEVEYVCYTGREDLLRILPDEVNLLFVCAFTEAAQLAYALSHSYRSKGVVTVIGGPHARCYPEDARQYFDYVLGFTDRDLVRDVLADASPHRPLGLRLQAGRQPTRLPGVQERWKFADEGPEPFELTKRFLDQTPAAFPGFSLLTSFGGAAPANLAYQRQQRVLPFPFHLLNNNHAMNVRPQHYSWPSFYDHVIDLVSHAFSWPAVAKRFRATKTTIPRVMNCVRAISAEGWGRRRYHMEIRRRLDTDLPLRRYVEGESAMLSPCYRDMIRKDLGPMWAWLPEGALSHDPYAYLRSHSPSSFSW